jgi:O-antigen ligase
MPLAREDWPARVVRRRDSAMLALVLAGAFLTPLVFRLDPVDMFRLPKALFLRAEAILLVSVALAAFLMGAPTRAKWRDPWLLMPLAAFATMVVLTLTSTNRMLSVEALASAAATLVVFLATAAAARRHRWTLLAAPLAAALVNAPLVIAEETGLWMPFGVKPGIPHHIQCDALIGNPNEVGSFLGAAALACLAAIATRAAGDRWTVRNLLAVAVLCAGLVASQTFTAIGAFAAGAFAMLAISSWKKAIQSALVGGAVVAIIIALIAPLRERARHVVRWTSQGDYNAVFTERFTSFEAAWSMFTDHPLIGVGPGVFAWQYFDYKIQAERRYPSLRLTYNRGSNFGQVHNDHLQVLAEGGLLGYAAFVALFGSLAALSLTSPADTSDPWKQFAHRLALPLAVFWLVLSIAQFPLETTVVRSLLVHLAALCVGWRNS